jgi:Clp amino terminal domain, pathogenicity island component/NTF2 fold immunity protein
MRGTMFELFTEGARRVIFFARYEASQYGSAAIETEHLLLGALKEDRNLVNRFSETSSTVELIRTEIEKYLTLQPRVSTSVDLPLSDSSKRVLTHALNEALVLNHAYVGIEHLLLGILREDKTQAAQILRASGLDTSNVRQKVSPTSRQQPVSTLALPRGGCVPDAETAIRIAEAVWTPLYGGETVSKQQPFRAELANDIWTIRGSPGDPAQRALVAKIERSDGRVLQLGEEYAE